jgi:hypothetical protein
LKWGDRNIEFGDPKIPFLTQPPECVGDFYDVPQFHTLFPDQMVPTDTAAGLGAAWHQGLQARSCKRKLIALNPGATAVVNFNLFTMVPKSARIWGTVWNDLMLEFNPDSPNAAGNLGVSYLPVALKDSKGTEVARFYTDQWGHFDGLVPANFDIAPPIPLGLTLSMLTVAPNDPGPVLDTRPGSPTENKWITDPWFNPSYSQEVIRENWEFYPGRTTFIDTIVLPVGGFVGNRVPLNCAYTDKTPELRQVDKVIVSPGDSITLTSIGTVQVPNPNYDPSNVNSQPLVSWDHGFGDGRPGSKVVMCRTEPTDCTELQIGSWAVDGGSIVATIPSTLSPLDARGQLIVTRGDSGVSTTVGVTLHAAADGALVRFVSPPDPTCEGVICAKIQPIIDDPMTPPGTIIVVNPGTYQENINLWKPVTLQGLGAAVTRLDGTAALANLQLKQAAADQLLNLIADGSITIVPGQASDFTLEQGAGILVAGCDPAGGCPNGNSFFGAARAQIDGLTITGANEAGGGILLNGYTQGVRITNDEIFANQGSIGGGVRIGESLVDDNFNREPIIAHDRIAQNGSLFSGGGGIALYSGTHDYQITDNMICGNFSAVYGGGIGHFGLSDNGLIQDNAIVSNESFDEGGGIHIGGDNPVGADALTAGAGSVVVNRNLIQGNKSGDDGGGIRTRRVNGMDVVQNPTNADAWYQIDIFNNLVVNNSSADHGGGMSFDDTVKLHVINNTIARNDSTATGSDAFGGPCAENDPLGQRCPSAEAIGGLVTSIPQVAGIASFGHSQPLVDALALTSLCASDPANRYCAPYSNPELVADIVWQNRSFFWDASINNGLGGLVLASSSSATGPSLPGGYWDFAIYGVPGSPTLSPTYTLVSNATNLGFVTPSPTNLTSAPQFVGSCGTTIGVGSCFNVYQATSKGSALGNFVTATFTPNGVQGDYHLNPLSSPAIRAGGDLVYELQQQDIDGDQRTAPIDIGADQVRAVMTVAPSSVEFSVPLNTAPQKVVTITNTTGSTLSFTRSKSGANPNAFSVVGPTSVGPFAKVELIITFTQSASPGTKSATLNIDPAGSATLPIAIPLQATVQ